MLDGLYDYAMAHVGLPYIWGGDDSIRGYDCSGFVQELLASQGITFRADHTALDLLAYFKHHGKAVHGGLGALVFYGVPRCSHVALMINDKLVIEAAGGGSKTRSQADAIRDNAFIRVRPYNHRADHTSIIMPFYSGSSL